MSGQDARSAASVRDHDPQTFLTLLREAADDHNFVNRAILTDLWWDDQARYEISVANAQTLMRSCVIVAETARRALEQLEHAREWNRPFPLETE